MINSENHITLKNINYSVNNKSFFKNLSTDISTNGITVILGPNGSGKSTLLGLLSGIFYPTNGKVNVYSDKFGYVGASPMIINATLRENLNYGNKKKFNRKVKWYLFFKLKVYHNIDLLLN